MRQSLNEILSRATGQPMEKIERDVDRDYIMDPEQALNYGVVDRIISSRDLTPVPAPVR
jgi:ATP-dependent Clp protease protease subunit